jgi:ribosomal RNA-processing protein 17
MASKTGRKPEKQPNWNIWNKPNVKISRAAPVILFDESSRKEYVTGFGKRKMQRKMIAQEAIKQQEKVMRSKQRSERKKEADEYIAAMESVKTDPEAGDGHFIDTRDPKDIEKDAAGPSVPSNIGTKVMYEAEDGGKVTALVSAFDDDSDSEEMPGLIPVSELAKKKPNAVPNKPKLKGNTSSGNVSSSLSSKKRKHNFADRKGFHKKSKH